MKKLDKAKFEELTVKLHNYFQTVPESQQEEGVNMADVLGKEDAKAYSQHLIAEAYEQHGILPKGWQNC